MSQPLLDLVGRNATFLVAHRVRGLALVVFTLIVAFGVPLVAGAIVLGVRSVNRRAAAAVHNGLLAVIVAAAVLVMLRVGGWGARMSGVVEIALSVAVAVAVTWVYDRSAALRRAVNYSAVAAPVVVGLFLLLTPARSLLVGQSTDVGHIDIGDDAPPIVIAIFDELPLATLLNQDHVIDRETFPGFAEFADDATFFRNVTGSHSSTFEAIPALLSGRYSETNTLPTAASHPTNIFSLLSDTYRPHALEPLTDLCSSCDAPASSSGSDRGTFMQDLVVVQLHLVLPDDLAHRLPPLDVGWRDFGQADAEVLDRERFREKADVALLEDTPAEFLEFTEEIRPSSTPTLYMVHTLLPHRPWRYLPDGRQHLGMNDVIVGSHWPQLEWAAWEGLQRHYAQTQLTDRLLGQLIAQLKATGLYEEALVVVASDHGLSFVPGTPTRTPTVETLNDIAAVPLFVKTPGQSDGAVSDMPLETIDILPTILDALGVDPVTTLEGMSAFDEGAGRLERRLIEKTGRVWPISRPEDRVREVVDRKFELFGAGGDFGLYRLNPPGYGYLRGRSVTSRLPQTDGLRVALARQDEYADVDPSSDVIPASIAGRVEGLSPDAPQIPLAVAVNGVIEAVTLADTGTDHVGRFRVMVPPEVFREGANEIGVLHVGEDGALAHIPPSAG